MKFSFEISRGANKTVQSFNSMSNNVVEWIKGSMFWSNNSTYNTKKQVNEAFNNPFAYMIIKNIADNVKILDYTVVNNDKEVTNGYVYELFNRPNSNQYTTEFIENICLELMTGGEAIIVATKPIGFSRVEELIVLKNQCTDLICSNDAIIEYQYNENGKITSYRPEDILHIRFTNIVDTDNNRFRGWSPLRTVKKVIEASNSNFNADAYILENRGVQGFISNGSDMPILPHERAALQDSFDKNNNGSEKFGKISVTNANVKYTQVGANSTDLQLLDNNIAKLRVLCSVYGLSSQLFGDTASSTYNNMEVAEKKAFTNCYIPTAKFIIDQLNKWINDTLKQKEQIKINFDNIEVLVSVNKDLTDNVVSQLNTNIITIEEARHILGYSILENKQQLSMNGIQIASLTSILAQVGQGIINPDSARGVIIAAFPYLSMEVINQMLNGYGQGNTNQGETN